MRLLLDTNVLIDYYALREPFADATLRLRVAEAFDDVELWASIQSFSDVEYVLRKAVPLERLRSMVLESLEFLRVCTPSTQDLSDALTAGWPDLEDFLIARSAQRVKADYILSRDEKGFALSVVPCITPQAFLDMVQERGTTYYDIEF